MTAPLGAGSQDAELHDEYMSYLRSELEALTVRLYSKHTMLTKRLQNRISELESHTKAAVGVPSAPSKPPARSTSIRVEDSDEDFGEFSDCERNRQPPRHTCPGQMETGTVPDSSVAVRSEPVSALRRRRTAHDASKECAKFNSDGSHRRVSIEPEPETRRNDSGSAQNRSGSGCRRTRSNDSTKDSSHDSGENADGAEARSKLVEASLRRRSSTYRVKSAELALSTMPLVSDSSEDEGPAPVPVTSVTVATCPSPSHSQASASPTRMKPCLRGSENYKSPSAWASGNGQGEALKTVSSLQPVSPNGQPGVEKSLIPVSSSRSASVCSGAGLENLGEKLRSSINPSSRCAGSEEVPGKLPKLAT